MSRRRRTDSSAHIARFPAEESANSDGEAPEITWSSGSDSSQGSSAPDATLHGVGVPIDVEYEQADDGAFEDGGPPPSGPGASRARGRPRRDLALIEPRPSNIPLPPWLDVEDVERENGAEPELVMLSAPASLAAQQFRSLRYRIEQDPDAQIIAVISPRSREGRSVTAANLALALAEGGRVRVLLIDASLSQPVQAALFHLDPDQGLTRTLRARRDDPFAPVKVFGIRDSLYVLPAGPRVISAHAALASEQAAHLLGACRRAFRYIVVDASPVFGSAETLAWHGMIDRYVMVARRGLTTTDDLSRASARLDRDKILGVTFVGAEDRHCAT